MKVALWMIGKTSEKYLQTGMDLFEKRLTKYIPFQTEVIPASKSKSSNPEHILEEEAKQVLQRLQTNDMLVLLDERGQSFSSPELANWLEQQLSTSGARRLIFLIGGAYGFHKDIYTRAQAQWSLSKLTFSHQMIRLFALEQLYRAMTILKNEPYHNY